MKTALLIVHVASWIALAVLAVIHAGPVSVFNCWFLLVVTLPALGLIPLAIAIYGVAFFLWAMPQKHLRATPQFQVALHGTVLTIGLVICTLAAHLSSGTVSCL